MLLYLLPWVFLAVGAVYGLIMTSRGNQTFRFGRFILHFLVGCLVLAILAGTGLMVWIAPLLHDLKGLHN